MKYKIRNIKYEIYKICNKRNMKYTNNEIFEIFVILNMRDSVWVCLPTAGSHSPAGKKKYEQKT